MNNYLNFYYILLQITEYAIAPLGLVLFSNRSKSLFWLNNTRTLIIDFETRIELIFAVIGSTLLFGISFLAHNSPLNVSTPWVFILCLIVCIVEVFMTISLLNKLKLKKISAESNISKYYLIIMFLILILIIGTCSILIDEKPIIIKNPILKLLLYNLILFVVFYLIYYFLLSEDKRITKNLIEADYEISKAINEKDPRKANRHFDSAIALGLKSDDPENHRILMDKVFNLLELKEYELALLELNKANDLIEQFNYAPEIKDKGILMKIDLLIKLKKNEEAFDLRKMLKTSFGEREFSKKYSFLKPK